MRSIDVHVHPMNEAYVQASMPFMPAAQRMFKGKFAARPDQQIAEDFRRDDALAIPIAWDAEHGAAGGVYANEALAALTRDYPDVFLPGWAMVDPWRGRKGLEDIEHAIKNLGLMGVKYQPPVQGFAPNDRQFYPLYEQIESLGVPALFHTGQTGIGAGLPGGRGIKLRLSDPMLVDDVAADFPGLTIILAHPSVPWAASSISIATHKANVFIDLSGWSPKYFPPELVRAANSLLQDKVLFGTDYPLLTPQRWLSDFEALDIKPQVRPKILKDNAVKLLGLGDS